MEDKKAAPQQRIKLAGQELLGWQVDEFIRHNRTTAWYLVAATIGLTLLIYAIATANFLFAVIVLMIGLILLVTSFTEPARIEIHVTNLGVVIGGTFYEYKDMKSFAVIYQPPEIRVLYLNFRSPWQPVLSIPLEEMDPNQVRETLLTYLTEDQEQDDERLTDTLRRLYKL
jgi:hypothetical protein